MRGMTWQSLKQHSALIPLYVCVGAGCLGAVAYTVRCAVQSPDVQWKSKRSGQIPNEEFRDKQYKFYSPNVDYSKLESPAPKY